MNTGDSTRPLPGELATATLPAADRLHQPGHAARRVVGEFSGSQCSLLGRRTSTSTGDSPPSVFRYTLIVADREVARLGQRVAEIAGQERVFEIIVLPAAWLSSTMRGLAIVLRREPGELLLAPR